MRNAGSLNQTCGQSISPINKCKQSIKIYFAKLKKIKTNKEIKKTKNQKSEVETHNQKNTFKLNSILINKLNVLFKL